MAASILGIDFGTSNTVLAVWDEDQQQVQPVAITEYSASVQQGSESTPLIPSLIHYAGSGMRWIGEQVRRRGLYHSRHTLRWMKQYISNRSPIHIEVEGQRITPAQAGRDFLAAVLTFIREENPASARKAGFSVPVESFEYYQNWLINLSEHTLWRDYVLCDEPVAAAIGYGAASQPGSILFVFDFGGGTLHASMVKIETDAGSPNQRLCRVLGKAGKNLGGMRIDQWLFQHMLKKNGLSQHLEVVRLNSNPILAECERVKERISYQSQVQLALSLPDLPQALDLSLSQSEFEELLDQQELFAQIGITVRSVLNQSREKGYSEDQIHSVLMIGGSSLIPSVQRYLRQMFGRERVFLHRPLDAVARGVALFAAGAAAVDHIRHDYAIRYLDRENQRYAYQTIIPGGTIYPTPQPVARLTIKASYDGQTRLGLAIFEINSGNSAASGAEQFELIFDPQGAARVVPLPPQQLQARYLFFVNEQSPTFLIADPPAEAGVPRFEISFTIDANKRLRVTALDLLSGTQVISDQAVIRLT